MQSFPCDAFRRNANGTWTSVRAVTISREGGGQIQIGAGVTFSRGVLWMGVNLAALLDANCT